MGVNVGETKSLLRGASSGEDEKKETTRCKRKTYSSLGAYSPPRPVSTLDAVEQAAHTRRGHRLPQTLAHALVALRLEVESRWMSREDVLGYASSDGSPARMGTADSSMKRRWQNEAGHSGFGLVHDMPVLTLARLGGMSDCVYPSSIFLGALTSVVIWPQKKPSAVLHTKSENNLINIETPYPVGHGAFSSTKVQTVVYYQNQGISPTLQILLQMKTNTQLVPQKELCPR
ncbi:hypothetical protein BDZ89DRAFT_1043365 [Hymenopellis radicata]|nr:hypothetical protein BDZ89DRAFT_1043365 [Hymenopellis radicata]